MAVIIVVISGILLIGSTAVVKDDSENSDPAHSANINDDSANINADEDKTDTYEIYTPVNTVYYPSNWALSLGRANTFLELLQNESNLDPGLFFASGRGDFHPIACSSTDGGRAKNRRIEIMIGLARYNPNWITEYPVVNDD